MAEDAVAYVCPRDRAELIPGGGALACPACGVSYPLAQGRVPVLIDDDNSVFSRASYLERDAYEGAAYGTNADGTTGWRKLYRRMVARLYDATVPIGSLTPAQAVARMAAERPQGRILVIGAGEVAYDHPNVIYTDVALGSRTACICDAHALPFPDGYFDGVLAVAVLEHVADPYRCVAEIHRVLAEGGMVYAATPFLQPVHMGAHDFTRFTYLGHRRLFRWFEDLESGCAQGPGASVGYAAQHLLLCLSDARWFRRFAKLAALLMGAGIRQADRLLGRRKGAYDAAAGTFFFGRKRPAPIPDREILLLYRGAQG
jgi:SAM-dependent methyltransferase